MEGVNGSFLWNLTRRRSYGDHIYRLPNLVCFGSKLPEILDVLSHQVCADVWGKVVEEETLEHEALSLVDTMIQRKQATHLAHQGGRLLVHHQGEGHQSLVPLKGVQSVEFREAFFVGFIRIFLKRKLDEINYLGGINTVEGPHTVVELGEPGGLASESELGLGLGKPNPSIICPEFWELDSHRVDFERGSGRRLDMV